MERITYFDGGKWRIRIGDTEYSGKEVDWLADYENTGLTPNEIQCLCDMDRRAKMAKMLRLEERYGTNIDRIWELVKADQEGRCVIMPVKEGDTVFRIMRYLFEDLPPEIFESPYHITDYYEIGNSVFLTEEAAEAKLTEELNNLTER